jgi:hypothetical protein
MNVADWDPEAVEHWALYYGFKEKKVIENIRIFHIGGKQLLSGRVTADFLEMTVPIARTMLVARIDELFDRDLIEKTRNASIHKSNKRDRHFIEYYGNNSKDQKVLNQVVSSENNAVASCDESKEEPSSDNKVSLEDKNKMLKEEAEESDENFGFGSMFDLRDIDEEKDALKLRRLDLDHIVDDYEEGQLSLDEITRVASEIEIAVDRKRTKDLRSTSRRKFTK